MIVIVEIAGGGEAPVVVVLAMLLGSMLLISTDAPVRGTQQADDRCTQLYMHAFSTNS